MRITIAIPTYNRADELMLTLRSLSEVRAVFGVNAEVIVVDNNSTDATRLVVEQAKSAVPFSLRRVAELNQGLCHARNRAIAESDGEIVALLDDDVKVDAMWLTAICDAFRNNDAAAVGGRAYLIYSGDRPSWITDAEEVYLSKVDLGSKAQEAPPGKLFGLNLALRKSWLEQVGLFRTDLDRIGNRLLSGGETELLERISAAGGKLWYEPGAIVGHRVASERLQRSWFVKRHYWGMRTQIRVTSRSRWKSLVEAARAARGVPKLAAAVAYRTWRDGAESNTAYERRIWLAYTTAQVTENVRNSIVGGAEPNR